MNYFWAKNISWHINVKQCKTLTRRGKNFFFSYHVVKVGEFMKLSYACEDIVSRGFSRN